MSAYVIETERLGLRPLIPSDAAGLQEVFTDGYAQRFYAHMQDIAHVDEWIRRARQGYVEYGYGLWALELKDGGRLVGDCGLIHQDVEGDDEVEIAYHVHGSYRRQGLATEAALACLEYGFDIVGSSRLVSMVHVENVASMTVAERIHAGRRDEPCIHAWAPHWLYFTERETWERGRGSD